MPDAAPLPSFEDELDPLLDRVLSAPEAEWSTALNKVCGEHPDQASGLRQRFRYLQRLGIAPDETTAPVLQSGSRFGSYDLDELLGAGAMGVVFRAVDRRTDDAVALKVLRPELIESPAAERRFRHEAEVLARHEHAALCRVHEVGAVEGTPFLAMELLVGETLTERLARSRRHVAPDPPDWRAAVRWVEDIARGLGSVHAEGVVHRDVKPANVMMRESGAPVLFDFGLAWSDAAASLTRTGSALGTPAYMPPEQVRGDTQVTPRADVWSLGATLYECLTLRPPFEAVHREDLYRRILTDDPTPVRRHDPEVPRRVALVVDRCLEKDPRRRYPDANALADDLGRAARGQRVTARAPGPLRRGAKLARRHPVAATLIGGTVILLLVLVRLVSVEREAADVAARLQVSAMRELSGGDPVFGALLAREAFKLAQNHATRSRLVAALHRMHQIDEVRTDGLAGWAAPSPVDENTLLCAVSKNSAETLSSVAGTWDRVLQRQGFCAAWSPDGAHFALGRKGEIPDLFAAGTGQQLPWPTSENGSGEGLQGTKLYRPRPRLAFDYAGRLYWGDQGGRIHSVSSSGAKESSWAAHSDPVFALLLVDRGTRLVSVSTRGSVTVSRTETESEPQSCPGIDKQVVAAALSGDGRRFALGFGNGQLLLLNTDSLAEPVAETRLPAELTCLAVNSDGTRVLVGTKNQWVSLWYPDQDKRERLHLGGSVPRCCVFGPGDETCAASFHAGGIVVLDLEGRVRSELRGHAYTAFHVAYLGDGREIVSAGWDHTVRRWQTAVPGFPVLRPGRRAVWCAEWLDDRYVVCAAAPNSLSLWDTATGLLVDELRLPDLDGRRGGIVRVAVAPQRLSNGDYLIATCGEAAPARRFRCQPAATDPFVELPPLLERAGRQAFAAEFDQDGALVVAFSGHNEIASYAPDGSLSWTTHCPGQLWDATPRSDGSLFSVAADGRVRRFAKGSSLASEIADLGTDLRGIDVDPQDPERLLVGTIDDSFCLLRTDGTVERKVAAHEGRVQHVAFSTSGDHFVTAGADGRARVFTRDGEPFIDLPHPEIVHWAAFSPDGKRVVTCGSDRTVRIWPMDDEELQQLADRLCFRGFTRAEEQRVKTLRRR